jgi:predicted DNA-binding transcriptional regulator AlpA
MTSNALHNAGAATPKLIVPSEVLLTPPEAAKFLKMSVSWLAKARMRGDGPPFVRIGRSIRYREDDLRQWLKGRRRLSTSEQ